MCDSVKLPDGFELLAMDAVDSSNNEAKRLIEQGVSDGVVIWALEQTAGRGRQRRNWISPAGNLYVSVVLRNVGPPADAAPLCIVAAVAMGEAIAECLPDPSLLSFKWPNDILIDKKKVCGLLLESGSDDEWMVIGSGVNVVSHPDKVMYPATDLNAAGAEISVEDLLSAYIKQLDDWRGRWKKEGIEPVREAWLARMAGLGDTISVQLAGSGTLKGIFKDLSPDGALLLEEEDGKLTTVSAGDVFFT
jgi:BirA family biotin operon repressor/biotin-[acetyl-CoA-carboxylase] ligase